VSAEIRGITDYSPHWLKSVELQSTDYSQDSWLQSSWNRERTGVPQAARYGDWWPALVLVFKTFAAFWHSLRRTYSLSSLCCTHTVLWCPRISANSFCTGTNNYRH